MVDSAIPELRRWRQEDLEFEASLGYMARPCHKRTKKNSVSLDLTNTVQINGVPNKGEERNGVQMQQNNGESLLKLIKMACLQHSAVLSPSLMGEACVFTKQPGLFPLKP